MSFKEKLIKLRKVKGLSQYEVSKRLGIARTTYAGYENGSREPDIEMINKIAAFFGVSTDYLLGNEKKDSGDPLYRSEIEYIISEAENKFKVNLRDDPVVYESIRQMIVGIAKTKAEQQKRK